MISQTKRLIKIPNHLQHCIWSLSLELCTFESKIDLWSMFGWFDWFSHFFDVLLSIVLFCLFIWANHAHELPSWMKNVTEMIDSRIIWHSFFFGRHAIVMQLEYQKGTNYRGDVSSLTSFYEHVAPCYPFEYIFDIIVTKKLHFQEIYWLNSTYNIVNISAWKYSDNKNNMLIFINENLYSN